MFFYHDLQHFNIRVINIICKYTKALSKAFNNFSRIMISHVFNTFPIQLGARIVLNPFLHISLYSAISPRTAIDLRYSSMQRREA